ncbi:ATP-binding protein, partial [Pseudomonas putida]|uniref:ATP-binding protein n=1 Tax=Pseudomonas putida TaxID=303 RepID=UPI003075DB8D
LQQRPYPDLSEVQGQLAAKRALLLAAAGAHNLLFTGPPGTGKTLLASRLPGLLPTLSLCVRSGAGRWQLSTSEINAKFRKLLRLTKSAREWACVRGVT